MTKLSVVLLAAIAILSTACEDKKGDAAKPATSSAATASGAAKAPTPAKPASTGAGW
jgi:hypothetical protein